MTAIPRHVQAYWSAFLDSPQGAGFCDTDFYESFRIGSREQDANEGVELILSGAKTATSSLLWDYERDSKSLPREGSLSVLEDGAGTPACVVSTTWIDIVALRDVDAKFAYDYGEGDRTLEGWRRVLREHYSKTRVEIGREMSDDTPLVCERFRVIYR